MNKTMKALAGGVFALALTNQAWALDIKPSISWVWMDDPMGEDVNLGLVNLMVENEDRFGNFHRLNMHRSFYDDHDLSSVDVTSTLAEFRLGRYWYPAAEPTDLGIWFGAGYWNLETDGSSIDDTDKRFIYLPVGIEYGTPIDGRGSWQSGFAGARHSHFFVAGAELGFVYEVRNRVDQTVQFAGNDEDVTNTYQHSGGHYYSAWLGYDYMMSSGNTLELRLKYQSWDVSSSDTITLGSTELGSQSGIDTDSWELSLGIRY